MNRPRPRFESEEQILKAIDKTKEQRKSQQDLCVSLYATAKRHSELFHSTHRFAHKYAAEEAERRARNADTRSSQLARTLKRLGERLSEFRTQRMPFLEDESIPR